MKLSKQELTELAENDGGRFRIDSYEESLRFCLQLTNTHYENFPVGSLFLPKNIRKHIFAIYAFSRIADDIADEYDFTVGERLALLDKWQRLLLSDSATRHPVFCALHSTLHERRISAELPLRLLKAFYMDVQFSQPKDWNDVLQYCHCSANPVGELVLTVCEAISTSSIEMSNAVCTALQLTNFWQDLSVDLPKNRCYIPISMIGQFNIDHYNLANESFSANFKKVFPQLCEETNILYEHGMALPSNLPYLRLKVEIAVTLSGGRRVLSKTRKLGADILLRRPKLTAFDYTAAVIGAFRYL